MKRLLFFVCAALAAPCVVNASAHAEVAASLAVQGEAIQPADLPLLVTLTLTNTGDKTLSYWCGSLDTYPGAEHFSAEAVGKDGKRITLSARMMPTGDGTTTYDIYNGQPQNGSGINRDIELGATITVPLAISPLPPGPYVLQFHSEWNAPSLLAKQPRLGEGALHVLVRRDQTLRTAREQALLGRVRHGEAFAENVVAHYNLQPIIEQLLPDLASDDADAAIHAAMTLSHVPELPAGAAAQISRAVQKHLRGPDIYAAANLLSYLALLAVKTQSAETLEAMILLVQSDREPEVRWHAAQALGQFHQTQAFTELCALLLDPQSAVRGAAAVALAQRHDAAALPVLLTLIQKPDPYSGWNPLYSALAQFPDDPQAETAVRAGLNSADVGTRWQAQEAQKLIQGKHRVVGTGP